jgi:hypothetical protein
MAGEDDAGGECEGGDAALEDVPGFWNIFMMSTLAILDGVGVCGGGVGDIDVEADVVGGGGFEDDEADMDGLPLTWPADAGTEPNDLTPSDLIAGMAAGEDDNGAETLSVVPNVTDEPGVEATDGV